MIVFYKKSNGEITGTIDGRIHGKAHLDMWIGDKNETERLIINWNPVGDRFEPEHRQKALLIEIDNHPSLIREYRVDVKTKQFVSK